jgi:isoprenylcysteine carboxyl methyltransferase (ICMT) family protein YpbQ
MSLTWFFIMLFSIIAIQRALETFAKREKKTGVIRQKWTFSLLFVAHAIVFIGSILEYLLLKRDISIIVTVIGLMLYLSGLIGRNWCIRTLGNYWSLHIEIRNNHKLIKTGPFKYIRHPAYLSIIFEVCGIPLLVNAYYTFLFAVVVYIPLIFLRIYYEEKEHLKLFGPEYLAYKKEAGTLSPRIRKPK